MSTLLRPGLAFVVLAALFFHASAATAPATAVHARPWQPIELLLQTQAAAAQPFDVPVSALVQPASGKAFEVPAFYDGTGRYRLRFHVPSAGQYTATTRSAQPDLNGTTWRIEVTGPADEQDAALVVSPRDPTRFARAGGRDVSMLAFECDWLWALDYGNAALPRTRRLLQEIAANGFNQVVLNVYAHDVRWPRPPGVPPQFVLSPPPAWPFGGTNDAPEHSRLNLEFFQHFDRVIALMQELKLSAHLMIYVWNKKVNWPEARSTDDNRYFDYIVKRYQGFANVVWDVSKEALGYGHDDMGYISERIDRIRALDAHRHLVTVHDYSYCNRNPARVDFISVQQWKTELYGAMREILARHGDKPVFNIEHGGYERGPYDVFSGDYDDPVACLERNYACLFAGCDSTYYWQDTSWNVLIWAPWELPEAQRPQWIYFQHLRRLLTAIDAPALKPSERGASSGYCLTDNQDVFVYFIPSGNSRINITAAQTAQGTFSAQWFDPVTGAFTDGGTMKNVGPWYPVKTPKPGRPMVVILRRIRSAPPEAAKP